MSGREIIFTEKIPAGLHDRAVDNWRPLLAIAELAGTTWSKKAREAAILCTHGVVEDESHRVELLRDLKELFGRDWQGWFNKIDIGIYCHRP